MSQQDKGKHNKYKIHKQQILKSKGIIEKCLQVAQIIRSL